MAASMATESTQYQSRIHLLLPAGQRVFVARSPNTHRGRTRTGPGRESPTARALTGARLTRQPAHAQATHRAAIIVAIFVYVTRIGKNCQRLNLQRFGLPPRGGTGRSPLSQVTPRLAACSALTVQMKRRMGSDSRRAHPVRLSVASLRGLYRRRTILARLCCPHASSLTK